jgi:hypothetical protein
MTEYRIVHDPQFPFWRYKVEENLESHWGTTGVYALTKSGAKRALKRQIRKDAKRNALQEVVERFEL